VRVSRIERCHFLCKLDWIKGRQLRVAEGEAAASRQIEEPRHNGVLELW
jgi:hypothetical protein